VSVAKVIEISSTSQKGFEDAIQDGIARATNTIEDVTGAWVKEQQVVVEKGRVIGYRVNLKVTFILQK
jgi:flavin-binding protein dodecin